MKDFSKYVYFQITQDSRTFRYFGLKENEWMKRIPPGKSQFTSQFTYMLNHLKENHIFVHDGVEKPGKLL